MYYKFLRLVPIGFFLFHLFLRAVRWNNGGCSGLICQVTKGKIANSCINFEIFEMRVRGVFIWNILKIFKYLQHRPFLRLEAQDTIIRRALRHTISSSLAVEHLHQNGLQPAKYHGLNLVNKIHPNTTWHILPTALQPNHSHPQGGNLVTLSIGLLHLQRRTKFERTSPQRPKTFKFGVDLVIDENICCSSLDHKELLATSTLPMSWACFAS